MGGVLEVHSCASQLLIFEENPSPQRGCVNCDCTPMLANIEKNLRDAYVRRYLRVISALPFRDVLPKRHMLSRKVILVRRLAFASWLS